VSNAISLVCYNIQRAIHRESLLDLVRGAAAFRTADAVIVQEATLLPAGPRRPEPRNVLADLAGALSPGHAWSYGRVKAYPDKEYGNGVIAGPGATLGEQRLVTLPAVERLRWWERLKTEGGAPDTKAALIQRLQFGPLAVRVVNVHLDFSGGWQHRRAQLQQVLAALAREDKDARRHGAPDVDILCGDFNTVGHWRLPTSRRNTRRALGPALDAGFVDATAAVPFTSDLFGSVDPADPAAPWLRRGQRWGLHLRQKTDHVLVRGPVTVTSAGVVGTAGMAASDLLAISDHLPLHVGLAVRREAAGRMPGP